MNPNQHGFRTGRSCLSQLLQHQEQITQYIEAGKNVDVVYLDFAKAFDKLDIKITLQKLYSMGVAGTLFDWIEGFLTNRKQAVSVDSAFSDQISVLSGVPQGSVLGPLLYLILLSDIDSEISFAQVSSFADDTRVMAGVDTTQQAEDFQKDLDAIYDWASRNNAEFNDQKFELLRYGVNEEIKNNTTYLSSNQIAIKVSEHVRDLVIIVP